MVVDRDAILIEIAADFERQGMDVDTKLKAIGPLLALCNRRLSEDEFRVWLDIYNIPFIDPVVERLVVDYINLLHYSGIITITPREEGSWMDSSNKNSFHGVTDDRMAVLVEEINKDIIMFGAIFD